MKTLAVLVLLYSLAFGQTPLTKAQKQDCSRLTKAFKKHAADPGLTPEDVTAMLAAVHDACGTKSDGLTTEEIHAIDENTRENIARDKEMIDGMVGNKIIANDPPQPDAVANKASAQPPAQQEQPDTQAPDIHKLVAQSSTALNREIALGNRLVAHLQKAQTREGIDADHPDAVALREKIAREEKEFNEAVLADRTLNDKLDAHRVQKECTKEEIDQWVRVMNEATNVLDEVKTQQERYHALGY